jgi:predicted permease
MAQLTRWIDAFRQDLGYTTRALRRDPRFSALVVVTLSLGIGASAALFSLADRLFFRQPAGVVKPDELRRLYARTNWTLGGGTEIRDVIGYAQFDAVRSALAGRVELAAYTPPDTFRIGDEERAKNARGVYASANLLPLIGARTAIGRTFTADEDRMENGADVAVIGYRLWKNVFAGDPSILGRVVSIARQKVTVIGVMADGFTGIDLDAVDVWLPLAKYPPDRKLDLPWYQHWRYGNIVRAVGRVSPGVPDAWISSAATTTFRRGEIANVRLGPDTATILTGPILAALGPSIKPKTEVAIATRLAGVVTIVLLIACANVANLLLVRGIKRERELAVRIALGVSRSRLIMLPILEAFALSFCAAVVAMLIASWGSIALARMVLPSTDANIPPIDSRVAVFTALVAVVTGLIGSVGPMTRALRPDVMLSMKSGARAGGAPRSRSRAALLACQAALSVVLLVGAGLFIRSLNSAQAIDLGMDTDHMIIGEVSFYDAALRTRSTSAHESEITNGMRAASTELAARPGVRGTALASSTPLSGWAMVPLYLDGGRVPPRLDDLDPALIAVTRGYFAATGMTLVAGRAFNGDDVPGSEPVVVVNETMARAYWPGESPLGKCVIVGPKTAPCNRLIGVVRDAHYGAVVEKPMVGLFSLVEQHTTGFQSTPTILVVRTTAGTETAVADAMRRVLRRTFPTAEPPSVSFTAGTVYEGLKPWRLGAMLFSMFGALALLVAAVGAYSVIAYAVSQRTHEIGVRMALGARASDVVRLVTGDGMRAVGFGILLGVVASLAMGRLVASMLYNTSPRDPIVLVAVAATLAIVAIMASIVPAWRAASTDPAIALRSE